jgi:hypothetical protein
LMIVSSTGSAVQPDLIALPRSCFAGLGPTTSWL